MHASSEETLHLGISSVPVRSANAAVLQGSLDQTELCEQFVVSKLGTFRNRLVALARPPLFQVLPGPPHNQIKGLECILAVVTTVIGER